jgi:hypothetical protein
MNSNPARMLLCTAMAAAPALLAGCAVGKTYAEIDPEGAKEDVRHHTATTPCRE